MVSYTYDCISVDINVLSMPSMVSAQSSAVKHPFPIIYRFLALKHTCHSDLMNMLIFEYTSKPKC